MGQVSLALPSPKDRPVTDDEYARFIQDCLDVNEHLLSELSSSLSLNLSASFATGRACDISQQLQATSTWRKLASINTTHINPSVFSTDRTLSMLHLADQAGFPPTAGASTTNAIPPLIIPIDV